MYEWNIIWENTNDFSWKLVIQFFNRLKNTFYVLFTYRENILHDLCKLKKKEKQLQYFISFLQRRKLSEKKNRLFFRIKYFSYYLGTCAASDIQARIRVLSIINTSMYTHYTRIVSRHVIRTNNNKSRDFQLPPPHKSHNSTNFHTSFVVVIVVGAHIKRANYFWPGHT
jgi:hypothetical protein